MSNDEPRGDERLAKAMYEACEAVKNCFQDGAPFRVTLLLRCEVDPNAHVTCGDDSFEDAIKGLQELAANKDTKARIVSRSGDIPKETIQ